jgi:V/A-type H+/Na+-transporting ATPase subunit K
LELGLIAIGAALAIGLAALATGWSQSKIGAAMAGALAEKPELVGNAIIMIAIPETMVVLGFVISFLIIGLKPGGE